MYSRTLKLIGFLSSFTLFSCGGDGSSSDSDAENLVCDQYFDLYMSVSWQDRDDVALCTHITESLWIRGTQFEDLSFLSNLTRIDGDLRIGWNSNLKSLKGLENLQYVGGNLEIDDQTELAEARLGDLVVEGSLQIHGNKKVSTVQFESLTAGSFLVFSNESLSELTVEGQFESESAQVFNNSEVIEISSGIQFLLEN